MHAVATVGNVTFVAFLALLLAHDRLFHALPGPPPLGVDVPRAERVVLIVIDGLRADVATDDALMPTLARLRQLGAGGEARVESLIPSTIAGVVALATGQTSPPADVLQDLRALPAANGRLFAAVKASGGRTYVAGPPVWADLYGRWIDGGYSLPKLVESDDGPLVEAVAGALTSDVYRLIVAHLGEPDDVAHAAGTKSSAYADAARAADEAVARLLAHTRQHDLVIVTADHGNTAAGGHAGPEEDVVRVPLVLVGPGATAAVPRRQAEIAPRAAAALGVGVPAVSQPLLRTWGLLPAAATLLGGACAALACGSVARGCPGRLQHTFLNGSIWIALTVVALGQRGAAVALLLSVLLTAAGASARLRLVPSVLIATAVGALLALLRLADGTGPTWATAGARNAALLGATVLSILCGRGIGRWLARSDAGGAVAAGAVAALAAVACGRVAGQTVSLSTLDVRAAYSLSAHPATLPLAILAVIALQAAPTVGVVAGVAPHLRRKPAEVVAHFAAGAGAVFTGQLLVGSLALWSTDQTRTSSLALGLLLRVAAESLYLFLGLAAASSAAPRPRA